ncbi:hypothetical protein STTU_0588 [Streptomyces sp. Tu6071]|nr:hypothetical protein STTU_0588 [Streptomyces sp. Tu6071]
MAASRRSGRRRPEGVPAAYGRRERSRREGGENHPRPPPHRTPRCGRFGLLPGGDRRSRILALEGWSIDREILRPGNRLLLHVRLDVHQARM